MDTKAHGYVAGTHSEWMDDIPTEVEALDKLISKARKKIEPWLSAVFQAEHFNLLVGSGLTTAVGKIAGTAATGMSRVKFGTTYDAAIDAHAAAAAKQMSRGDPNIEDQFRSALAVLDGLEVTDSKAAAAFRKAVDDQLSAFLKSLMATESGIISGKDVDRREDAEQSLVSFLLSFASRAASRERLHIFTTNYDRLVEHGCDLAGLRLVDRFVGGLNPVFRSSRIEVDIHYNPPGIRGEPRYLEGVVRLSKLHGSLDWYFSKRQRQISRKGLPFGAPDAHSAIPKNPLDTVMIYPNPAKDVETTAFPYAELFRDFAAAICRPNSVVVSYGYGFGDDHVNRVLADMLTIPSTHLVIITYSADVRLRTFLNKTGREAQTSLLIGSHFSDLSNLVEHYLPKPALDFITSRMTELLKKRPTGPQPAEPDEFN
jgi:SIR2-like domain